MNNCSPELVANIWPIVDSESGIIQRFAARAYAINGNDQVLSATLRVLAQSDYLIARQFSVPKHVRLATPHGTLTGAIQLPYWGDTQSEILEEAFKALEEDQPTGAGMGLDTVRGHRVTAGRPVFPPDPYLITTFIEEDPSGNLRVIHAR